MKIGLAQFAGHLDKASNLRHATELIRAAAAQGANVVCLHELASTTYFPYEERAAHFASAEPIPGPTSDAWSKAAAEAGVTLVATMFEATGGTAYYNSALVIDADGELLGVYRKTCIPHIRSESRVATGFEKYYFRSGNLGFPVFRARSGLRIGVLICFDRHFPENYRALALGGAELICVPTTAPQSAADLWSIELRSAAHANSCWVAGVNRAGIDEGGADRCWFGNSLLVSPDGDIVAQAKRDTEDLVVAELDLTAGPAARAERGYFRDRRPDLYGILCQ